MTRQKFTLLAAEYKPHLLRFANSYFRDSRLAETVVSETIRQGRETCETSKDADELPGYWLLRLCSRVIRKWLDRTVHHNSRKPHEYPVLPEEKPWRTKKTRWSRVATNAPASIPAPDKPNPPASVVDASPVSPGTPVKNLADLYERLIARGVLLRDRIAEKDDGAA